ncbi:MAG: hypothetical protein JXA72_09670 [Bacteroidales bacterium]|nr:hypothetical protein [Bacteroidales bacterium]
MNWYFRLLPVLCILLCATSCDIRKSDAEPSASFTAVYDHPDMDLSFYPIDMVQTSDEGFLVLSVFTDTALSTFPLIRLMKTDKSGKLVREELVNAAYCSAVPSLVKNGNVWQFVCMDAVNQNVKLMEVSEDLSGIAEVSELSGKYPLYLYADSRHDFVVLSFDRIARTSVLTKYTDEGTQLWQVSFNIIEDYKNQVETHLKKGNRQFPFFITQAGSPNLAHYLVNCFYNYTMTLLFAGQTSGNRTGQLNTYQDDAAISSIAFLDNSRFAVSRYYMGANYVFPSVELDMNNTQGADTFDDIQLPELTADAAVKSLATTLNNREVVVMASQTKSNRLVLYFFDKAEGALLTTRYLASTNPVKIAGLIETSDNGLALLAQTFVAGRFPRTAIFKVSPEDISFD